MDVKWNSELQLRQIMRAYESHCAATSVIPKANDEAALSREICNILVVKNGYSLAWVGFADQDDGKSVVPIASAGCDEGYLEKAQITWADTERGQGPTGKAIRTGVVCLSTDTQGDPKYFPWRKEALKRGFLSSASFPLKDGDRTFGALNIYAPEPDAFGENKIRILGQVSDCLAFGIISIRKTRREKELKQEGSQRLAQLEAILDSMIDGVLVCDEEGYITLANRSGLQLLGVKDLESMNRLKWETHKGFLPRVPLSQEKDPLKICPLERALRGEVVRRFTERLCIYEDEPAVTVQTTAVPIKDSSGEITGAVKVVRDITEYAEFERMKEEFISVAAHELKSPLTTIKGYSQALLKLSDRKTIIETKMLEGISHGTERIEKIIQDLLDISLFQFNQFSMEKTPLDLSLLLEEAIQKWSQGRPQHPFEVKNLEPVIIRGDRGRLSQVLNNLISNAITYSPNGGKIQIQMDRFNGRAQFSIHDEGIGIPRQKKSHIFQKFYRAHSGTPFDYGGLGVGLFISKEIIKNLGGRMWFQSEEGKGSDFYFDLPICEDYKVQGGAIN